MNLEEIYKANGAYLEGHFLLSSKNHSQFYLQSAKVLENPALAGELALRLYKLLSEAGINFDTVCSPALGGIIAGYELARASGKRFIFTERSDGIMSLRRGFEVKKGERFIICEDVITTGGSAKESMDIIEGLGGVVVGFAALASRGFCPLYGQNKEGKDSKLPVNKPFFALGEFNFEIYEPLNCPLCKKGSAPIKPGSRK